MKYKKNSWISTTFDLFNQLTFGSISLDFTAATLNDETVFQTVVSGAISSIDTTFEIQTEYEALIKITEFQRGPRLNFQLLCMTFNDCGDADVAGIQP